MVYEDMRLASTSDANMTPYTLTWEEVAKQLHVEVQQGKCLLCAFGHICAILSDHL